MKIAIYISIAIVIIGCSKAEDRACFKSAGETTSITHSLSSTIHSFEFRDDMDIILIEDSISFVKLTGPKNLLNLIEISEESNTITLSNGNQCDILRKEHTITAEIHSASYREIYLRGYGSVSNFDSLKTSLTIDALNSFSKVDLVVSCDSTIIRSQAGAVETNIKGKSNYIYVYNVGQATFNASHLETANLHFNNSGISDLYGWCNQIANIEIHNQGNVILKGTPNQQFLSGIGDGELIITP